MKKIFLMLLVLMGLVSVSACNLGGLGGGDATDATEPEHTHSTGEVWQNDATNHWQTCDGCDEQVNLGTHTFGEWSASSADKETRTCTVCSYEESRDIVAEEHKSVIYYYNSLEWETVNAYVWDVNGETLNGSWPGNAMVVDAKDGWYTVTLDVESLVGLSIIFNNGTTQTADITLDGINSYYYGLEVTAYSSMEAVEEVLANVPEVTYNTYYLRGDMNGWGTTDVLVVDGTEASIEIVIKKTESFKVATSDWNVKAYGMSNGQIVTDAGAGNITVAVSGKYLIKVINLGQENETVTIELIEEIQDTYVKNEYYYRGTIGGQDKWNLCDDTVKFVAGEDTATFEVELSVGDQFKVSLATAWAPQYNASSANLEYPEGCFGGTDNINVLVAGKYKLEIVNYGTADEKLVISVVNEEEPEITYNTYYLRGDMNDWGITDVLVVDGTEASIEIVIKKTESFKVATSDWNVKAYGMSNGQIVTDAGAGNITVAVSGKYLIKVINLGQENETVTIELIEEIQDTYVKNEYYYRGTIGGQDKWNLCDDTVKFVAGEDTATFEVELSVGDQFKVSLATAWAPQYNASSANLEYPEGCFGGTDNINVLVAGKYKLEIVNYGTADEKLVISVVNEEEPEITYNTYYLRGDMNDWGITDVLVVDGTEASIEIVIKKTESFKVATEDWNVRAYGMSNGQIVTDAGAGNITVAVSGKYLIKVINLGQETETVTIELVEEIQDEEPEITYNTYYFRGGSFGWNDTNESNQLVVVDGVASIEVDIQKGAGFKIATADWKVAYGANSDGTYSTSGGDISLSVSGKYLVQVVNLGLENETLVIELIEASTEVVINTYYLRGDMNGWGDTDVLTVNGSEASIEATILKGQEFKVATLDWSVAYGVTSTGAYAIGGNNVNISMAKSGVYLVKVVDLGLDSEALVIELIKEIIEEEPETPEVPATGMKVYLKPNSNWLQSNARFAVYGFGNSGDIWVDMTDSDGDGIYEAIIDVEVYPTIIFCRMNPNAAANNWNNKWNQTADLPISAAGTNNCYEVKANTWDKGGGTWSTIE